MVFVYTAKGVLCVEHANVLELCYIELLSGDGSPYSIFSGNTTLFGIIPLLPLVVLYTSVTTLIH